MTNQSKSKKEIARSFYAERPGGLVSGKIQFSGA